MILGRFFTLPTITDSLFCNCVLQLVGNIPLIDGIIFSRDLNGHIGGQSDVYHRRDGRFLAVLLRIHSDICVRKFYINGMLLD